MSYFKRCCFVSIFQLRYCHGLKYSWQQNVTGNTKHNKDLNAVDAGMIGLILHNFDTLRIMNNISCKMLKLRALMCAKEVHHFLYKTKSCVYYTSFYLSCNTQCNEWFISYLNHNTRTKGGVSIYLPDLCLAIPKIQLHNSLMNFMLTMHGIGGHLSTSSRTISTFIYCI